MEKIKYRYVFIVVSTFLLASCLGGGGGGGGSDTSPGDATTPTPNNIKSGVSEITITYRGS